jgi:hypothetical protein
VKIVGLLNSAADSTHLDIVGFSKAEIRHAWLDATLTDAEGSYSGALRSADFESFEGSIRYDVPDAEMLDIERPHRQRLVEVEVSTDALPNLDALMRRIGLQPEELAADVVTIPTSPIIAADITPSLGRLIAQCDRIVGVAVCPLHGQPPVCRQCRNLP